MTAIVDADFATLDNNAIKSALREMMFLKTKMLDAQVYISGLDVHPTYVESAKNLLCYLALRRHDIRPLQHVLSKLGLSSLGRAEANVLASVERVIEALGRLDPNCTKTRASGPARQEQGEILLSEHTQALFGNTAPKRGVRIMVTMPSEAANEYDMVKALVAAGMDCQRINCAHDGPNDWLNMIAHARRASSKSKRGCCVVMDLAGPKLRTGKLDPAPPVIRIRPSRDVFGRVVSPGKVWLYGDGPCSRDVRGVSVPVKWLSELTKGDDIIFNDARESKRRMRITEVTASGCWADLQKTAYFVPGLTLNLAKRSGRKKSVRVFGVTGVKEQAIELQEGELLILTKDPSTGHPAVRDPDGRVLKRAMIGCTLSTVFHDIQLGEPVWFDDGKIGGVVKAVKKDSIHVLINHAPGGVMLKSDKGINLPATDLKLDAFTADDIQALEFACAYADVVEMSFVNTAADVRALIAHLTRLNALDKGVVLKIETRHAFENLAELLVAGMHLPRLGVMIARGDLAIENGLERTAELQEEILRICEAAHVPVIWATQVLETLAKKGSASRAEITDAAMGGRAECVMLNKGPYIDKAISTLDEVLIRMQAHRCKNTHLLRKLAVARGKPDAGTATRNQD